MVIISQFLFPYSPLNHLARVAFFLWLWGWLWFFRGNFKLKIGHILLLSFLFSFYSVVRMKNLGFSGDEPHYLLITKSLIYDGDINVKNQYLQEQWREFYRRKWVRILPHARPVNKKTWLSIHLPGTSALAIPFYLAARGFSPEGKKLIIRLGFSLYGLLFLYLLYLLLKGEFPEDVATYSTALVAFTVPAFPFFFHVFPEIPVALILTFSLFSLWKGKKLMLVAAGLGAGALPWFGAKYTIYLIFLLGLSVYFQKRKSPYFLLPALLPSSLFFLFLKHYYGSFSLLSVYYGPLSAEQRAEILKDIIYRIPWHYRFSTFLDYLLDQRDGLLPYAPVAVFSLAALIKFWRKKIALSSLILVLPFVFNYGWQTHRGGYCPPARPLASAVWALAVGFALFLKEGENQNLKLTFRFLAGLSLGLSFFLSSLPSAYYGPTTHDVANRVGLLFHRLSTPAVYLPRLLPSFTKHPRAMPGNWVPNYLWVPLTLLFLLTLILRMKKKPGDRRAYLAGVFMTLLLPLLALPQIPLARGMLFMGERSRPLVYNWSSIKGRCLTGGRYDPIVFITKAPLHLKGRGTVLLNGRKRRRIEGEEPIFPSSGMPFMGGRLLAFRLLKGDLLFCP